MRIVFMGTPDFAVPSLKKLIENKYEVVAVFTQPDKPFGRKHIMKAPPVKETAIENGIEVFQPVTLKDECVYEQIKSLSPDLIVVVAYGKILPKRILDIPQKGCINVHGSLLPQYRGAAPIQWCVLNGETQTGITTMYMGEGLDTGDMLLKAKTQIEPNETAANLFNRLAPMGADLLVQTIEKLDNIVPEKQDESLATYSPMISKDLSPINWNKNAQCVHNQVRALAEWPVATTYIYGKKFKVHSGSVTTDFSGENYKPGTVIESSKSLIVACSENTAYRINEIQPDGKKKMSVSAFLAGNKIEKGIII